MDIPFMTVGNGELSNQPTIKEGDKVYCDECQSFHQIKINKAKACTIESMRCPITNKCFIVGVDGRLINGRCKKIIENEVSK